jgi:hypothetical protein
MAPPIGVHQQERGGTGAACAASANRSLCVLYKPEGKSQSPKGWRRALQFCQAGERGGQRGMLGPSAGGEGLDVWQRQDRGSCCIICGRSCARREDERVRLLLWWADGLSVVYFQLIS